MEETLFDAKQELKRVDHLIFVSLKYTRTADVLKNVIERLVSSIDLMVLALLEHAKEENRIEEIPAAPIKRCDELALLYKDDTMVSELCGFYTLLRRINKMDYDKENEYRRHVGMIFDVDGKELKINIDQVTEYYKRSKEYIAYIQNIIMKND